MLLVLTRPFQMVKKYERGDLPKSDWLDALAFRKMEEVHAAEAAKSESLFLYIDLPRFDFPVIFSELVRSLSHYTCRLYSYQALIRNLPLRPPRLRRMHRNCMERRPRLQRQPPPARPRSPLLGRMHPSGRSLTPTLHARTR